MDNNFIFCHAIFYCNFDKKLKKTSDKVAVRREKIIAVYPPSCKKQVDDTEEYVFGIYITELGRLSVISKALEIIFNLEELGGE